MKKTGLLSLLVGLSFLKFAHADTITSAGSVTQRGAKQETISSGQAGKPPRLVKPAPVAPAPVVIVPAGSGQTTPVAPAGK